MTAKRARKARDLTVGAFSIIFLAASQLVACVPWRCSECRTIEQMEKQVQPENVRRQRFERPKGVPANQSKEAGMVS